MNVGRVIAFVGGPLGPKQYPLNMCRPQAASYG